jgi:predicted dehydrogenase
VPRTPGGSSDAGGTATVSFIGAGNFATAVLIPAFKKAGADLRTIASSAGVSGLHAARKFGFADTTTESAPIFSDTAARSIVITTRHDTHARFVLDALRAGKNVFVEKPLCLTLVEADEIEALHKGLSAQGKAPLVMVGFNRRFAPHVLKIQSLLTATPGPKTFVMTVNAGAIPADHWTQDLDVGGGRIVGEACHFIDLLRSLSGAGIVGYSLARMASAQRDTVSIQLEFADGSLGSVHYLANGSKKFPKERLEIFGGGGVLQLDNFRKLTGFGWPGFTSMNLWRQDKGHAECAAAFLGAVKTGGPAPIPFDEMMEVSRVTIALAND